LFEVPQGLNKVVERLCSLEGVDCEVLSESRVALEISHNGASREVILAVSAGDYRFQKIQYGRLCQALRELGITEGLTFVAAKLPQRPMTPPMHAAREKQKKDFDAWQEIWRSIRKAEKALDVAYEIAQMQSYY
jgi:hypothetical protein